MVAHEKISQHRGKGRAHCHPIKVGTSFSNRSKFRSVIDDLKNTIVICNSIQDHNTIAVVRFQNHNVLCLLQVLQDSVFLTIDGRRSMCRYVEVCKMRKISHQFSIVFFINQFLCHSAMYKFKAGEDIRFADTRSTYRMGQTELEHVKLFRCKTAR